MTYVLGLTGSIATGKSTVSQIFKSYGFPVVDADIIAHEVVAPGTPGLKNIVENFGPEILQADGQLDRKKLGQIVFADENKRQLLNRLNGHLIRQEIFKQVADLRAQKQPLIILDIPLLYESHYEEYTDGVMVAYVPEALQIKRLMARDGYNETDARHRIESQINIEEKRQLADFYTDNSGDIEMLKAQIQRFLQTHNFI
ncbi:dephospho-CoA kinase [Agrilactobacillus yilanensis]|uniref:Dephospho-CoA kinase n=1 Tax=Agrilactobacillus yilanensis TaxID=2485997 RepID=A0ABW4J9V4_9LACO